MKQGLGFAVVDTPVPIAFHGGATIGSTAFLGRDPVAPERDRGRRQRSRRRGDRAAVLAHLSGRPAPRRRRPRRCRPTTPSRSTSVGRYARRHVVQDVEFVDGTLMARTTFEGPAAELFPQPPVARLEPLGGARFASRHPFEPEPSLWDFVDDDRAGRPARLFTQRVQVRALSAGRGR